VVAGNKMLLTLNTMQAEEALSRAVESCRYNRDPRSLELAITRAIHDGVSADLIANAKRTLAELDSSHMTRNKALAALDQAVRSRDINSIKRALQTLSELAGGGVAPGPEADRARKVMLEIYREESTIALKQCLSSPAVMTAEGFDEEKFLRLWKAVEEADRYLPQENELLIKGKARLEEQELLRWKCSSAAANLLRAMDALDIAGEFCSLVVSLCVRVYVCMYVCMYACMYLCLLACLLHLNQHCVSASHTTQELNLSFTLFTYLSIYCLIHFFL
jgi:hypothetical protein